MSSRLKVEFIEREKSLIHNQHLAVYATELSALKLQKKKTKYNNKVTMRLCTYMLR